MEQNITDKPESGKKYSLLSLARSGSWAASEVEDGKVEVVDFAKRNRDNEAKAALKAVSVETIAAELRKQYPWARSDVKGRVQASKNLKKELALAFPGVKFSVTSESFSMGNAVRISWTDGPTGKEIDEIAHKYEDGSFDGSIDLYSYDSSAYGTAVSQVLGRAKYVTTSRHLSARFLRDAVIEVCFQYHHEVLPVVIDSKYGAHIEGGMIPYCNGAQPFQTLADEIMKHARATTACICSFMTLCPDDRFRQCVLPRKHSQPCSGHVSYCSGGVK